MENGNTLKTIEKTFDILTILLEHDGAGVSEVAEQISMPTSTVHDYLRTLEQMNHVVRKGNEYHVGMRFLYYGGYARHQQKLYRIAKSGVENMAEESGEHANLMIEEQGEGVFLYQAKGADAVRLDTFIGNRVPLHSTAQGKAILANLPEDKMYEIVDETGLKKYAKNTITEREELFDELKLIREQGYATEREEYVDGMGCVGAPIKFDDGQIIGAISCSAPLERFEEAISDLVCRTANVIELNITHSP
ncbi:IclR family transcriptional regulator [Natrinema versiforme JCM 10478]|uniref:IclR family transcriptional regulator n=1 Tax=Natrinema versiforme JCM 10478 TaxID=1227496 RepID=L9XN53_9EURY|nr:IclR family transcriptional regulator [Natrinema versiforme JCM 10478]